MSWLFLSWSSHLEGTVYMCLSALKQNMHFLCTNQFEASTCFLSPWTTHGNFTVFHALGVGNLNLAWVGWWGGGEFEPVECVTFDFTTFVDHTKNCLYKIVLHWGIWMQFWPMVGRNFNKPIFKSLNARGVACGRDVTASNWLMHYNLDLKPVLLQSILCCYSSLY